MAATRLTQKIVDAARWEGSTQFIRDAKTSGLILAVNKTSKTWKVQADLWRQKRLLKTVRHTLGSTDELPLARARERAGDVLKMIRSGLDPNNPHPVVEPDQFDPSRATLGELWSAYEVEMRARGRAESTIKGYRRHLDAYLKSSRRKLLVDMQKSWARAEHERITANNGPYPANHVMRSLRAAWNWAVKLDDHDALPANPVIGVTFNKEHARDTVIFPEDLPAWWAATGELPSPLRTTMHRLGLLSGLRPGTLVGLERSWIDIPGRAVHIPRMKSGKSFDLPLSGPMVSLIEEALKIGDALHSGSPFLFPTRCRDGSEVVATRVWRERRMPGQTGHILRHTYRTLAEGDELRIPTARVRCLLGEELTRIRELSANPPDGVPKPTFTVFTGGGFQLLWALEEPIPLNGTENAYEDARLFNKQLELRYGGDNCSNIDRVLRLPGTTNLPDARKRAKGRVVEQAELRHHDASRVYPINQFHRAGGTAAGGASGAGGGCLLAPARVRELADLDELHQYGLAPDDRLKVIIDQGRHPDEQPKEGKDPTRSGWVHDLCCNLVRRGVPDDLILGILLDPDWGISESVLEQSDPDKYARRQGSGEVPGRVARGRRVGGHGDQGGA